MRRIGLMALLAAAPGCMLTQAEYDSKVSTLPDDGPRELVITSINPDSGPRRGGTEVAIGVELDEEPLVYFDGLGADVIEWGSNGVRCTTPRFDSSGWVDVEVWSGADYGVAQDGFYVE